MRAKRILAIAAVLLPFLSSAEAADRLRPGEWETTLNISMKGGPQIPPDQLAMMKKMGVSIPGSGEPIVSSRCITPEMAAADKPFPTEHHGDDGCELKNFKRSGNKASGDMVCNGEVKGGGPFEMTLDSDTAYHGGWSIKGTSKQAGPIEQTFAVKGKWLKAACDSGE